MSGDQPVFDLDAYIAHLEAEVAAGEKALQALRELRALATSRGAMPGPTASVPDRAVSPESIPPNAFFGMRSIGEAARKYLDLVKRKQTTRQIVEGLEHGGFPHRSKNFYNTVYTILNREEAAGSIIRIGSEWAIASWFPGHGRRPKPEKATEGEKKVVATVAKLKRLPREKRKKVLKRVAKALRGEQATLPEARDASG